MQALLLAHEEWSHAVGIHRIATSLCLCHEGQHPAAEVAYHHFVSGEALHQGAQTVGAVPLGQGREVLGHGMIRRYVQRLGSDAHPFEPGVVVAVGLYIHQPGHIDTFADGEEVAHAAPIAVLALLAEQVVAQLILAA